MTTHSMTTNWLAKLSARTTLILAIVYPAMNVSSTPLPSTDVVLRFVAAYNEHHVAEMMSLCTENVRWLTVLGESVIVEAEGKATLTSQMHAHFEHSPNTYSTLLALEGDGPMVIAIEQASTGTTAAAQSQCSASVYQLNNGLIENVWYFDAYACGRSQ